MQTYIFQNIIKKVETWYKIVLLNKYYKLYLGYFIYSFILYAFYVIVHF